MFFVIDHLILSIRARDNLIWVDIDHAHDHVHSNRDFIHVVHFFTQFVVDLKGFLNYSNRFQNYYVWIDLILFVSRTNYFVDLLNSVLDLSIFFLVQFWHDHNLLTVFDIDLNYLWVREMFFRVCLKYYLTILRFFLVFVIEVILYICFFDSWVTVYQILLI